MGPAVESSAVTADDPDADDQEHEARLWPLIVSELLFLVGGFALVAASLLGRTTYLTGYSVRLRLVALAFLVVELLVPLGVYLDLRRRPDDPDRTWLHAAVMPVVNVFGVLAYLEERRRKREE